MTAGTGDGDKRTCGKCGKTNCDYMEDIPTVETDCKDWTPKPAPAERQTTPLDIIKELHKMSGELATMIAQEQEDVANGLLVDCYDAVGAALVKQNENAYDEPENPIASKVGMDHNGSAK